MEQRDSRRHRERKRQWLKRKRLPLPRDSQSRRHSYRPRSRQRDSHRRLRKATTSTTPNLNVAEFYAGCGGISTGMAQVRGMRQVLAVERDLEAAGIFRLNCEPGVRVLAVDAASAHEALLGRNATATADDTGITPEEARWLAGLNRGEAAGRAALPTPQPPDKAKPALQPDTANPDPNTIHVLAAGPPCQGNSGANREADMDKRALTNVHAMMHVSLAERLRPDYFILENVSMLAQSAGSARGTRHSALRSVIASLLEAGFQVRFAVMDAAQGLGQSRARLIVMAAAPGRKLPSFPAAIYTTEASAGGVSLNIAMSTGREEGPATASAAGASAGGGGGSSSRPVHRSDSHSRPRHRSDSHRVDVTSHFKSPSPTSWLRNCMLGELIEDLPESSNTAAQEAAAAGRAPRTQMLAASSPFQVALREGGRHGGAVNHEQTAAVEDKDSEAAADHAVVPAWARDHIARSTQGLELARLQRVPRNFPGANWRCIPNEDTVLHVDDTDSSAIAEIDEGAANGGCSDGARGSGASTGEPVAALRILGLYGGGRALVRGPDSASNRSALAAADAAGAADPARAHQQLRFAMCACHLPETQAERLRLRSSKANCAAFVARSLVPYVCVHTADAHNGWGGSYGRLWPGAAAGALLTTMALPSKSGAIIHPWQDRIFTPREAARLQGFPDSFDLGVDAALQRWSNRELETASTVKSPAARATVTASTTPTATRVDAEEVEQHCDAASAAIKVAYHVIGNAVPPTFGRALAQAILAGRNTAAATGKF